MNVRFHPDARREVKTATRHYTDIDTNLGNSFRQEIDQAISSVMNYPKAWQEIAPGIRRYLTNRFPYGILYNYQEEKQEIYIVAVMHTRQKPGYWKSRYE